MTHLPKSASPSGPRFIETKLINVAASVARREYIPSLEKCRTISDARQEVARCDNKHADLAHKLKTIADELRAAEPRRDEREAPNVGDIADRLRSVLPYWESEDKDDYMYLVREHDIAAAAIAIHSLWAAQASAAPLPQTPGDILNRKRLHHDKIERVLIEQYFAGKSQGYTLETADKIAEALNFPTVNVPDLFNDWKMRTYKKNCYGRDDMIAFGITVMRKCDTASLPQPSAGQWISVQDRLPEKHTRVLIWFRVSGKEWRVEFGDRTSDGHWRLSGGNGNFDDSVTYWQEVPAEPSAGQTEEVATWCCKGNDDNSHADDCKYSDKNYQPKSAVPEDQPKDVK